MRFRYRWPSLLALLSLFILGSYLIVTERVVREIRYATAIHMRLYAQVQGGLELESATELRGALAGLREELAALGVPIIAFNSEGEPLAAENLPFEADPANPDDWPRLRELADRFDRQNPPVVTRFASYHFGEPPILGWLRWVPWLQVSGGVLALVLALVMLRASLRAERERMWAAMARELAHQMGTPLSSMAGWLELLRLPPEERARLAPDERIAQHLAADVERLERVSRRFEIIGQAPALERIEVATVLEELEAYLRPRLPRLGSGVDFKARIQRNPPPLYANRVLLAWALENLVKNALDALAGRGGHIRVVARPDENGSVYIGVADNGPGIPPSIRNRIFEPGVTTKSSGWGVGLALARRIIEDYHGGRIEVRPRRGGGTVFEVRLPGAGSAGRGAG